MRKSVASIGPGVHPHQLEVQEFSSYALVIDARAPAAYDEDHLPSAVNLPIGLLGLSTGTAEPERGLHLAASTMSVKVPHALAAHLRGLHPGATVLVYCDRGGLDAEVWATPLRQMGYEVDVLAGGWINYRRWVVSGLEVLTRSLVITRLQMPPEGGQAQVLAALKDEGEQVLDIAALLGSLTARGMHLPGEPVPSQSAFESALLGSLRGLDHERRVWVGDVVWPFAELSLPPGLRDALAKSSVLDVAVPSKVRAKAWLERLLLRDVPVGRLFKTIGQLGEPPSKAVLSHCHNLEQQGQVVEALDLLIEEFIDPYHSQRCRPAKAPVWQLNSLMPTDVTAFVVEWLMPRAS